MHILFIGRDRQGLNPASDLAARWRGLVASGVRLTILLLCEQATSWEEPGIRVIGSGGSTFLGRWLNAYRQGRDLTGIDLISAQDPAELALLGYFLGKQSKVLVEMQDHGGWFDGSRWIEEPLWPLRKACADWLLTRVQSIRTVNPQSFERLRERFGKRVYFLPIACAERFFTAQPKPTAGKIVCVARFVPVKRHILLLQAFAVLAQTNPNAKLTLVGSGPLETKLRQLARDLRIDRKVEFVQTTNPLPHLESAERFVLLSSHEGWGVAAVEAAAVGVPVLMTSTGCAPWLEEKGLARQIKDLSPSKIAAQLKEPWGNLPSSDSIPHMSDVQREQIIAWKRLHT
ncbi:glycosyltransferase [Patescibacteria group bacterium]|nr:glycosyltransferase [Patescibacteria group bacterium]